MQAEETWLLSPRDTCYFGVGVPFAARETAFLTSRFPPSPTIIQGAVRTAIVSGHGTTWDDYYERRCNICGVPADQCAVISAVGSPDGVDDMRLDLRGPFLYRWAEDGTGERLYPVPADLMVCEDGFVRLEPGEEVETDIGRVRLPALTSPTKRTPKSLQGKWITETGLIRHLSLAEIDGSMVIDSVFSLETRVGVGRNREKGTAEEGLLYSLHHVRMREGYAFGVRLRGLPAGVVTPEVVPFGGDRRLAYLESRSGGGLPSPSSGGDPHRFRLVFLTPAKWEPLQPGEKVSILPGLSAQLVSACMPKAERLGGWRIAAKRGRGGWQGASRPMEAVVPAGSVFFFQSDLEFGAVVRLLHDQKIGRETSIGFGHVAVGAW